VTFKGVLATAVALLAVCLMVRGQSAAPVHRPALHVTTLVHHKAAPHALAKRGKR
jgi:hypothetical protein